MHNLISYIITSILQTKEIEITAFESNDTLKFVVKAPQNIKSKIIGKNGKVINSVRDYIKSVSKKFNKKVYIEINDN